MRGVDAGSDLQGLLINVGAIKANDSRLREPDYENEPAPRSLRSTTGHDDDDWD